MGVTVFDDDNYVPGGGQGYLDVGLGTYNTISNSTNKNKGMEDQITSIRMEPDGGYRFCGYKDKNLGGTEYCYSTSIPRLESGPKDVFSSFTNKINCDHGNHTWAGECNHDADTSKALNRCQEGASCWNTRKSACDNSNVNLGGSGTCLNWCRIFPHGCVTSIDNYCKGLDINTMNGESLCNSKKSGYIDTKCKEAGNFGNDLCKTHCATNADKCIGAAENYCKSKFNSSECTTYCIKNPEKCKTAAITYCDKSFDNACKEFCTYNIGMCTEQIKKYCVGNNIKSDPWCRTTLLDPLMSGKHDIEMQTYCNGIGKQRNLTGLSTNSVAKSKEIIDKLENPICACFDNNLINLKFDHVKNEKTKPMFTSRPQCFYSNCISDSNAYKKTSKDGCNIKICNIEAETIDIKESKDVEISNNCGADAVTNPYTPAQSDGTPSTGIGSNNKINCQMSDWTRCSKKCTEGIEKREWIAGPLNGGEPCGPASRECKIPCTTIKDQLENSYFNFNDLDQNNKIILIVIFVLIILILILFMLPSSPQMPYSPQMQMPYSPQMQMPYYPQMQMRY